MAISPRAGANEAPLSPVKLRGYGEVSGEWKAVDGGSTLKVRCESEAKAKLFQAKYVSDLQVLPGVSLVQLQVSGEAIPAYALGDETFLAARDGKEVWILTAASPAALTALEQTALPHRPLVFKPEVDVPMYLDRWDKYGLRFYYAPMTVPDGQSLSTYDKNTDFAWSVKNQTGLQVWDPLYEFDLAQGISTRSDMRWVADSSRANRLPLGINLSTINQLWLENWYPDDMAQHAPEFLGSYYNGPMAYWDGSRFPSWNSTIAEDTMLGAIQDDVRYFDKYDNVTSWLEPHGEIGHGDTDFLMEYGPPADRTFRQWLEKRYGTVGKVSERWTGRPDAFQTWNDIHVPEMASFCGWSADALDLTGSWKVNFLPAAPPGDQTINYPTDTFAETFDDSSWPALIAPGDAHAMLLPKDKPAVFRRTFTVDGAWLKAHPRVWLYEFDLNYANGKEIIATLNGKEVGRSKVREGNVHRDWFEVTSAIKEGPNVLALALPQGFLAYRVYLSGTEPKIYPFLGKELDARWADFAGWAQWSRIQKVERGMQMIRQVDPDRGIIMMTPGPYYGDEQELSKKYGGDFHDTGGMQGWWNTFYPQMMNGVGMPVSVETGGPDKTVEGLEETEGRFTTEGIQGVDYFLQIGDILWHPEMRANFEENLKLWKLIGKYHVAPPQYATFYSGRDAILGTFPWNLSDKNLLVPMGFSAWGWYDPDYPGTAGISEAELLNGSANKYKVIFDSNSSILDQDIIDAIAAYVKQGGIFVTYVQTGRDSPTEPDSWPISQLTGYSVTGIDPYVPGNDLQQRREIDALPNQSIFTKETWTKELTGGSAGLSLKKVAPECTDLLVWKDGSIAAGMRPLGKGYVFDFGVKYDNVGWGDRSETNQIFDAVLEFAKIPRDPIHVENAVFPGSSDQVDPNSFYYRHFLSNNGLYDVFSFWNRYKRPVTADLVLPAVGSAPTSAIKVKTGETVALTKNAEGLPVLKMQIEANESQSFLTPRADLATASRDWFALQREWWKGTTPPPARPLPSYAQIHRFTLPLDEDWAFKTLTDQENGETLAAPGVDDSAWEKRAISGQLIPMPDPRKPQTLLFRKHFTVPPAWNKGSVTLFMTPTEGDAFSDPAKIYCDGVPLKDPVRAVIDESFGGAFKAGTGHVLAVEMPKTSSIIGCTGSSWLYYRPDATEGIDLAGDWESSEDGLHYDAKIAVPGSGNIQFARRSVTIPDSHAKQTVMLHVDVGGGVFGAVVNGQLYSQSHVPNCPEFDLNVTPSVRFGAENQIEIVAPQKTQLTFRKVSLDFYAAGIIP